MKLKTEGRTDIEEFFKLSGIREFEEFNHHPALVFQAHPETDELHVRIVSRPRALLTYSDETRVMMQWRGQWRSDFFQFTIGDLKRYIAANPPAKHHVI